jgi:hypothetical protein
MSLIQFLRILAARRGILLAALLGCAHHVANSAEEI